MASSTKYEKELLSVIKKHRVVFFDHCFGFTTFSRGTAYNHNLHELDAIKDAINQNKVKNKNYLINKWIESDNPTLNVAAYRLMSDSDEHKKLNQSYVDHTTQGDKIAPVLTNDPLADDTSDNGTTEN
jgi:hypothetical protein